MNSAIECSQGYRGVRGCRRCYHNGVDPLALEQFFGLGVNMQVSHPYALCHGSVNISCCHELDVAHRRKDTRVMSTHSAETDESKPYGLTHDPETCRNPRRFARTFRRQDGPPAERAG